MVPIVIKHRGNIEEIQHLLEEMASFRSKIGILAEEGAAKKTAEGTETSPLTILQVATAHEFGLGVPQRSFVRSWSIANKEKNIDMTRKAIIRTLKIRAEDMQPLKQVAAVMKGDMQRRMSDKLITPPLSKITILRKKSDVPLIDTGQLRASIHFATSSAKGAFERGVGK